MSRHKRLSLLLAIVLSMSIFSGCSVFDGLIPQQTPAPQSGETQAMVTFRLTLPEPLPPGNSVHLVLLDEITGLPFNQQKIAMTLEDSQHLVVFVPLPIGRLVKYRYARQGDYLAQEYLSNGQAVRYRVVIVDGPIKIEDSLSRWVDTTYSEPSGRIVGKVLNSQNQLPVADMLVFAGGMQTTSAMDGSFRLEGLPPGTHNLVVAAPDGSFRIFEQGALVAAGSATPAEIMLVPNTMVKVVFIVQVPQETPNGAVVRIAGNLSQLGATFAEQRGDISVLSSRMPVMQPLPDGRFTAAVDLPVGSAFMYRYTLGDGLWNAEHTASGSFGQRVLSLAADSNKIEDSVSTWRFGSIGSISFSVDIPSFTPVDEQVSIQFNPGYGWTEPVPMWPSTQNQWRYTLFSPLIGLGDIRYRYCRALDCDSADDSLTMGALNQGRSAKVLEQDQSITENVNSWAWFDGEQKLAVVPSIDVIPRGDEFIGGVAFQGSGYNPNWDVNFRSALRDASQINANWVYYSPTWSVIRANPPVFELTTGRDMSAGVLSGLVDTTTAAGLKSGLFPKLRYPNGSDSWWSEGQRDFGWWVSWFEAYRVFIRNYAILAQARNASQLIIGGQDLTPALPGGVLSDGTSSGLPSDADIRWTQIISDIRSVYSGDVLWAVDYPNQFQAMPEFVQQLDGIYILWSVKLSNERSLDENGLAQAAGAELDTGLLPWQQENHKAIILSVGYPSATGAVSGCVLRQEGTCVAGIDLARPHPDLLGVSVDLEEQQAAYNAIFRAVNSRPWISGVVSDGYYPPAVLADKSYSVRGKPAAGVLWFWFGKFLGK